MAQHIILRGSLEDLDCEFGKEMIEAIKSLAFEFGKNIIPAFAHERFRNSKLLILFLKCGTNYQCGRTAGRSSEISGELRHVPSKSGPVPLTKKS